MIAIGPWHAAGPGINELACTPLFAGSLRRVLGSRLGALLTALLQTVAMVPAEKPAIELRIRQPRRMLSDSLESSLPRHQHLRPAHGFNLSLKETDPGETTAANAPDIFNESCSKEYGKADVATEQTNATPAAQLLRYARYTVKPHAHLREATSMEAAAEVCRTLGALGSLSAGMRPPCTLLFMQLTVNRSLIPFPALHGFHWILASTFPSSLSAPSRSSVCT